MDATQELNILRLCQGYRHVVAYVDDMHDEVSERSVYVTTSSVNKATSYVTNMATIYATTDKATSYANHLVLLTASNTWRAQVERR